jgi:hypothetical protein
MLTCVTAWGRPVKTNRMPPNEHGLIGGARSMMRTRPVEALLRFGEDGRIEINSNVAERAWRVVAVGGKNFLCAGSDGGGESAAAITVCSVRLS